VHLPGRGSFFHNVKPWLAQACSMPIVHRNDPNQGAIVHHPATDRPDTRPSATWPQF
jgi:hypothetical protein